MTGLKRSLPRIWPKKWAMRKSVRARGVFEESLVNNPDLGETLRADIIAHYDRDPACRHISIGLYYKGFLALQAYRAAHWMISHDRRATALYIQNRASEVFQADILGRDNRQGVFIDHATGVVIGETRWLATMCRSLQRDIGVAARKMATGIRKSAMGCSSRLVPKCLAISGSGNVRKSAAAVWY